MGIMPDIFKIPKDRPPEDSMLVDELISSAPDEPPDDDEDEEDGELNLRLDDE